VQKMKYNVDARDRESSPISRFRGGFPGMSYTVHLTGVQNERSFYSHQFRKGIPNHH
jgi:hypothetical protein